jgi:Ni,Fe-hydrogenase III large subunit
VSFSGLLLKVPVAELPQLDPKAWRADVVERQKAGARVLSLFGRRDELDVLVTAVFRDAAGALQVSRTRAELEHGYDALTHELPGMHCFERELHEQTGLRLPGHPWLKPIRYQGQDQAAMSGYPWYRIEGKEVHEVAVGPIHAGVIEPGSFRFSCLGEQVHHLEIHLGYQHRGVEELLVELDPRRLAPLVETISGDSSVAHAWAYCAALEALANCNLALETEVARAVALELERIAMHLAGLSGLAADIGFLQGATTYGRLRTTAINTSMRLCGSRFGRGAVRPRGVGLKLAPELLREVRSNLELMGHDVAIINDCFFDAQTVQHRLQGVGVLSESHARELGVVGMIARSSGLVIDTRDRAPEGAWKELPVDLQVFQGGDCWARAGIRMREIDASLKWLARAIDRLGAVEVPRRELGTLEPSHLVCSVIEGWRGEVIHCLETDEFGDLAHYKVQDPSLRNWMGLAVAVRGNEISDFPICNKSFDLSYCGNDL